jgi:hypothetical protein
VYFKPQNEIEDGVRIWSILFVILGVASFLSNFFAAGSFVALILMNCLQELGVTVERSSRLVCGMLVLRYRTKQSCDSMQAAVRQRISFFDSEENTASVLTTRLATDAALVRGMLGTRISLTVQNIVPSKALKS